MVPVDPQQLVIVARDGVINQRLNAAVITVDSWKPIPGSLEAIARLNHAGFSVVVVTNQTGVGEGEMDISDLNAVHVKFQSMLARVGGHVDGIFFCPHAANAGCDCRMPRPGLMASISQRFGITLDNVPFVGDSAIHAETALAAGAMPVMVRTGNGKHCFNDDQRWQELRWVDDLASATCHLLEDQSPA